MKPPPRSNSFTTKNNDDMNQDEDRAFVKIRDLSEKLLGVLRDEDADNITADMALTRLLATLYSMQLPEVADRLVKLHCDNLRYSVREIRETRHSMN